MLEMEAWRQPSIGDALQKTTELTEISYKPWNGSSFCWRIWEAGVHKTNCKWVEQGSQAKLCILSFYVDKYDVILCLENILEKPVQKFDPVSELDKNSYTLSKC